MNFKYLIDLDNHEKSGIKDKYRYAANGEIEEVMSSVQDAEGPHMHYNMTDTVMNKVPSCKTFEEASDMSHAHDRGFETFFIDSGEMYLYIDGVRVLLVEGDLIHLQPRQQHAMASLSDVKFRGFFHDLDSFARGQYMQELTANMPEAAEDPDFRINVMGQDYIKRERPTFVDVPSEKCNAVKNPSRPLASYELDGCTVKIMIPRWENWGVCEVICAEMKKGFSLKSSKYPKARQMFYVRNGKVKFSFFGQEFIATKSCLVNIPQYANYTVEALEDSEVYDMGGQAHWFEFFQDYKSLKENWPERFANADEIKALKEKFDVCVESISF